MKRYSVEVVKNQMLLLWHESNNIARMGCQEPAQSPTSGVTDPTADRSPTCPTGRDETELLQQPPAGPCQSRLCRVPDTQLIELPGLLVHRRRPVASTEGSARTGRRRRHRFTTRGGLDAPELRLTSPPLRDSSSTARAYATCGYETESEALVPGFEDERQQCQRRDSLVSETWDC